MWTYMPDTPPPDTDLTIAGFCSGIGMLELATELALERFNLRSACVAHVERDCIAAALLVALGKASGNDPAHHFASAGKMVAELKRPVNRPAG